MIMGFLLLSKEDFEIYEDALRAYREKFETGDPMKSIITCKLAALRKKKRREFPDRGIE